MKKIILKVSTVFVLSTSASFSMPVMDGAQIVENIMTAGRWIKQGYEWKREIKQWEKDFKAITKFRLDSNILDEFTKLNNLLKKYGLDMEDLDLNKPKSEVGVYAKKLFNSYMLFDDCKYKYFTLEQKNICQNKMVRNVQEMATIRKLSENMTGLIDELNTLNTKLENSEDIKSSQDITAGIQSTISSMEAIKMQYEMLVIRNKAKKEIEERQAEQIEKEKRNNSAAFINQAFL